MRGCRGSSCGLWSFVHFMWLCIRIPSLSPRGKNLGRLSGPAETFHPTDPGRGGRPEGPAPSWRPREEEGAERSGAGHGAGPRAAPGAPLPPAAARPLPRTRVTAARRHGPAALHRARAGRWGAPRAAAGPGGGARARRRHVGTERRSARLRRSAGPGGGAESG